MHYAGNVSRTDFAAVHCSIARTFDVLHDGWSALILRDVQLGISRFDELVDDLGVSRKVLAARLGEMVDAGVLERRPYQQRPDRFDYVLTEAGRELIPPLLALMAWGDRWRSGRAGPPVVLRHHDHPCRPIVVCEDCATPIDPATVQAQDRKSVV